MRGCIIFITMPEMYPGIEDTELFAVLRRCMDERTPNHMENEFTYPDGTVKEEVFNSQYVAWKETWLVGMAASSTEPVAELIVEPSLPAAQ